MNNLDKAYADWAANWPELLANADTKAMFEAGWNAARASDNRTSLLLSSGGKPTAEAIYAAYPKKVGRRAAIIAIDRAAARLVAEGALDCPYSTLLQSAQQYAAAVGRWPKEQRVFVPHPATWFNQERYMDDPAEWEYKGQLTPATSQFSQSW